MLLPSTLYLFWSTASDVASFFAEVVIVFYIAYTLHSWIRGSDWAERNELEWAVYRRRGSQAHLEALVGERIPHSGLGSYEIKRDKHTLSAWEWYLPNRRETYQRDIDGTTQRLSTSEALKKHWGLPENVSEELGTFTDLIVRDFILSWYNDSISKEPQFPDDVRQVLENVVGRLVSRVLSINLAMFIFCDVSYVLRHHLRWFFALKKRASERCNTYEEYESLSLDERNSMLLEELVRAGHLHPACAANVRQGKTNNDENGNCTIRYIRSFTNELLVRLLSEEDYHCNALRHLVREVLTCDVLGPALEIVSPDLFNIAIIQLIEAAAAEEFGYDSDKEEIVEAAKGSSKLDNDKDEVFENYSDENIPHAEPIHSSEGEGEGEEYEKSISLIQSTYLELNKEESLGLFRDLEIAIKSCLSLKSQTEVALTTRYESFEKLLLAFDRLFCHGLKTARGSSLKYDIAVEAWWDFVRHAAEVLPSSAKARDAIDAVIEIIKRYREFEELFPPNDSGADSSRGKVVVHPGKAWLSLVLKQGQLSEVMVALLQDDHWLDRHYEPNAAIRQDTFIPLLAFVIDLDVSYSLEGFWRRVLAMAAKLKKHEMIDEVFFDSKTHILLDELSQEQVGAAGLAAETPQNSILLHQASSLQQKIRHSLENRVGAVRSEIVSFISMSEKLKIGPSSFTLYILKFRVTQITNGKEMFWSVYRRYRQFSELHNRLLECFGNQFSDVAIPKKGGYFLGSKKNDFLETRKRDLEEYIRKVLCHPIVSESDEVYSFILPSYEDLKYAQSIPPKAKTTLECFSNTEQNKPEKLHKIPTRDQTSEEPGGPKGNANLAGSMSEKYNDKRGRTDSMNSSQASNSFDESSRFLEPSVDPRELRMAENHVYRLAEEVFNIGELSLLRRNILSLARNVISLVFQGTAYRWLRNNCTRETNSLIMTSILSSTRKLLWPKGKFLDKMEYEPSSEELRAREINRNKSLDEMIKVLPVRLVKFLGTKRSNESCKRLHEFLQHPAIIQNLLFTTLDVLILRIFPDFPLQELHGRMHS